MSFVTKALSVASLLLAVSAAPAPAATAAPAKGPAGTLVLMNSCNFDVHYQYTASPFTASDIDTGVVPAGFGAQIFQILDKADERGFLTVGKDAALSNPLQMQYALDGANGDQFARYGFNADPSGNDFLNFNNQVLAVGKNSASPAFACKAKDAACYNQHPFPDKFEVTVPATLILDLCSFA